MTSFRQDILKRYGASGAVLDELLEYNSRVFNHDKLKMPVRFPLADEKFVPFWEIYAMDAERFGVINALRKRMVELNFPIMEGISKTPAYQKAIRRGVVSPGQTNSHPIPFDGDNNIRMFLHRTPAGRIPVIVTAKRSDFVMLVQALAYRNEPKKVPASMGACMVSGYNNWDRIKRMKNDFLKSNPTDHWPQKFTEIIPRKDLYQDKFIIMSSGNYSAAKSEHFGLSPEEWFEKSMLLRKEHEGAHYLTKRLFGSTHNNLTDEMIADYAGIAAAAGEFKAEWFFRFFGMENYPKFRKGGRLQNYRGNLSNKAFKIQRDLLHDAVLNLENFDRKYRGYFADPTIRTAFLLAMSSLTLEEMASKLSEKLLAEAFVRYKPMAA